MITSGEVGKKWDAGDGTLMATHNYHQMVKRQWGRGINHAFNLTIKNSKWERKGERVGNPAPITKITINQRW